MQLRYKETVFDTTATREYDLSIRISADGFSFCIYNAAANTFLVWKHISFAVQDTKQHHSQALALCEPYLAHEYKNVSIVFTNTTNTLIPEGIVDAVSYQSVLAFNFSAIENTQHAIFTNKLGIFSMENIFAIPTETASFWTELFPQARILHTQTSLIEGLLRASKKEEEQQVWLHVEKTNIFIAYADKGKLIISNSFQAETPTDILYMCGNLFEQFDLSQQKTPLVLSGKCTPHDELHTLLQKHIATILWNKPSADFEYDTAFNSPHICTITDLLLLPICVS